MKFGKEFWLILFREYISPKLFAVQHRISLLSAASVCKKCLSHSKRDGDRTKQCEERSKDDHWLCRFFSDPKEGGVVRRLLPVVTPRAGRLVYNCRTEIHVKSRKDLESDSYSVKLTTLYDSKLEQSYIVNEVALAEICASAEPNCVHVANYSGKDQQTFHPGCEAEVGGGGCGPAASDGLRAGQSGSDATRGIEAGHAEEQV